MADPIETEEDTAPKASKLPLVISLVLALVSGGGGFYAVQSGLLFGSDKAAMESSSKVMDNDLPITSALPDVVFVPVDPLVISLNDTAKHLRFRAQLEVRSDYGEEVVKLMPRVVDVLNNYLRAIEVKDLSDNASLARLRSQMLRRVQIVTGGGRVNDLLIMEFVLN